jgi:hypothetical protein
MLDPTNYNIIIVLISTFILRYIVLKYLPTYIINGYFSIFFVFFIITYLFTSNYLFSIIIGMISVNSRILYRHSKDQKTLSNYNSYSNCFAFLLSLVIWFSIIKNFKKINNNFKNYYDSSLLFLLLINLASFEINKNNNNLMCLP